MHKCEIDDNTILENQTKLLIKHHIRLESSLAENECRKKGVY